jgi:hypothetical protein
MELSAIKDTQDSIQLEVSDPNQRRIIKSVAEKYEIDLNVNHLTINGAVFEDSQGRKIGVCHGDIRGNLIHTGSPYAEIMILGTKDGILLGWIDSSKMSDASDRFLVSVKSLNAMPSEFRFAQPCPHLSVYGGYLDIEENNWRCFGCDTVIPFIG